MKKSLTLSFIVCFVLLSISQARAQGWQWGKTPANHDDTEEAIVVNDKLGNTYTTIDLKGEFLHNVIFDSIIMTNPMVVKNDSSGRFVWALHASDYTHAFGLACDPYNNLYVFGMYYSTTTIGSITLTTPYGNAADNYASMYFLAKFSPDGTVQWVKNISPAHPFWAAGFSYKSLSVDKYGNAYIGAALNKPYSVTIGATTLTNADTSGATSDIFIAKYDPSGTPLWAKRFGGAGTDFIFAITVTENGSLYISGNYSSDTFKIGGTNLSGTANFWPWFASSPLKGSYLAKFAPDGTLTWAHNVDYRQYINNMVTDANENLYVTGHIDSTMVFGTTTVVSVPGSGCPYISRYSANGDEQWVVYSPSTAGSTVTAQGYGLALDACGNLWMCGNLTGAISFSGHPIDVHIGYYEPTYMVEYDTAGNYQTAISIAGAGEDGMGISVDNRGNLFLTGDYYMGDLVFNNDTLAAEYVAERYFVAKYKYQTSLCAGEIALGIEPVSNIPADEYSLYPDPAQKEITITAGHKLSSILITNLLGKTIYKLDCNTDKTTIDIANIPNGVYLVRIDNKVTKRFVKE